MSEELKCRNCGKNLAKDGVCLICETGSGNKVKIEGRGGKTFVRPLRK